MENNNSVTSFEQHLDNRYSEVGTEKRMAFEAKAKAFAIRELIKDERLRIGELVTYSGKLKK